MRKRRIEQAKRRPSRESGKTDRKTWIPLIPCALALCAYLPSLASGFIFDDQWQIVKTPPGPILGLPSAFIDHESVESARNRAERLLLSSSVLALDAPGKHSRGLVSLGIVFQQQGRIPEAQAEYAREYEASGDLEAKRQARALADFMRSSGPVNELSKSGGRTVARQDQERRKTIQ